MKNMSLAIFFILICFIQQSYARDIGDTNTLNYLPNNSKIIIKFPKKVTVLAHTLSTTIICGSNDTWLRIYHNESGSDRELNTSIEVNVVNFRGLDFVDPSVDPNAEMGIYWVPNTIWVDTKKGYYSLRLRPNQGRVSINHPNISAIEFGTFIGFANYSLGSYDYWIRTKDLNEKIKACGGALWYDTIPKQF